MINKLPARKIKQPRLLEEQTKGIKLKDFNYEETC